MPAARPDPLRDRPLTSDPRRLVGVDMRSLGGRRYRAIVEHLAAEFGTANAIALRELAGLRYTLEQTQAAIVSGDTRARTDLVRISNLIARRERELRERSALLLPPSHRPSRCTIASPPSMASPPKAGPDDHHHRYNDGRCGLRPMV
jgi:hypothetical protein